MLGVNSIEKTEQFQNSRKSKQILRTEQAVKAKETENRDAVIIDMLDVHQIKV